MKESKRIQREIAKETGASPGEINEALATRMLIDFGTAIDARRADISRTSPERPQAGRAEVSAETRSLETSAMQKEPPSAQHQDTPNSAAAGTTTFRAVKVVAGTPTAATFNIAAEEV